MIKYIIIFVIVFYNGIDSAYSQCISSGARPGSVTANNTSIGSITWTNCVNACASDDARTTASALLIGDKTNYLIVTGFGFSLPDFIPVCGITVEVESSATGLLQIVSDNSIKLVKAGTIIGSNKASGSTWPSTDAVNTYGNSTDLWGTTWTYSDINDANFGVAISANLTSLSALPSARIDLVRITVHYDITTLPIKLVNFYGDRNDAKSIDLKWETMAELNSDFFDIERSFDGYKWQSIGQLKSAGNSSEKLEYHFIDSKASEELSYYRLKQVDNDQRFDYSNIITVAANVKKNNAIDVFPNPFNDVIHVNVAMEQEIMNAITMNVIDASGEQVLFTKEIMAGADNTINLKELDKGLYIINVRDERSINKYIKILKVN